MAEHCFAFKLYMCINRNQERVNLELFPALLHSKTQHPTVVGRKTER